MHTGPVFDDPARVLAALLDMLPQPVLFADVRGRVVHGNPAACALLGYPLLEVRSLLHVSDIYHRAEDARRVLHAAKEGTDEHSPAVDVMLRARSGELVSARIRVRVYRAADGAVLGTIGVVEDQREVADLTRRLEEAANQVVASEKRAAVVALASKSAHDLSQPLMAAMGNLELLLLQPGLDNKVAAKLERAYEQLERIRAIVSDFVRMTGVRTGA